MMWWTRGKWRLLFNKSEVMREAWRDRWTSRIYWSNWFLLIQPRVFLKSILYSGWWYTYPSEKYENQLGLFFPTEWKVIKFHGSKPPTSIFDVLKHTLWNLHLRTKGAWSGGFVATFSAKNRLQPPFSWLQGQPRNASTFIYDVPKNTFLMGFPNGFHYYFLDINLFSWLNHIFLSVKSQFFAHKIAFSRPNTCALQPWCCSISDLDNAFPPVNRGWGIWSHRSNMYGIDWYCS